MGNILVCPDLHGRRWLLDKAINIFNKENLPICFLGDYLDCYQNEFENHTISSKETIEVFKELIEFAKENRDRVTLLIADHECHYVGLSNDLARFDKNNAWDIHKILKDNESLFKGAYIYNNAFFTHAGVSTTWLKLHQLKEDPEFIYNYINNQIKFSEELRIPSWFELGNSAVDISDIGHARGGDLQVGGPMWCDIQEIYNTSAFKDQITQIFGHSQLEDTGTMIHKDNFYMCDSRAVFIWNGETLKLYD